MAEAVNYALSQWTELNVFCSDGTVSIDNNVSEREMKRVVLNRKNSLFVGNPRPTYRRCAEANCTTGSPTNGNCVRPHDCLPSTCASHSTRNIPDIRPPLYWPIERKSSEIIGRDRARNLLPYVLAIE